MSEILKKFALIRLSVLASPRARVPRRRLWPKIRCPASSPSPSIGRPEGSRRGSIPAPNRGRMVTGRRWRSVGRVRIARALPRDRPRQPPTIDLRGKKFCAPATLTGIKCFDYRNNSTIIVYFAFSIIVHLYVENNDVKP